jgi:serine/threonine protein kinase
MASDGGLIAGRYRVGGRLGRGGMGTVWRANDELLGRQVAVKELHPAGGVPQAAALREARAVAQIKHRHVIVVHDVVEEDGRPWIVMELIDGRSLADLLAQDGPVEPREAARIGAAVTGALRAAHGCGVLHRDIKPANVLIERESGRVVLTDFGIARVAGSTTLTGDGAFVGSPEYTAPERMSGLDAGPESDLWSLGVLLCEAVTGRSPFRRDSLGGVLHAVVFDEIRPPVQTGPLLPVVAALLERDPARRMGAAEVEERLRALAAAGAVPVPRQGPEPHRLPGAPSDAVPPARGSAGPPAPTGPVPAERRRPPHRRRPLVLTALATVLVGGGVTVAALNFGTPDVTRGRTSASASAPASASAQASALASASALAPTATVPHSAPPGFRTVKDPKGFSLAVPTGFYRSYEPPRIFYYSAGKQFRLGIRSDKPAPKGPLAVMREQDTSGPGIYDGYRDGIVTGTTQNGNPAALWEFTWNGFADGGGTRRTYDLCWTESGRQYDVWVSSPIAKAEQGRTYLETAAASFHASD